MTHTADFAEVEVTIRLTIRVAADVDAPVVIEPRLSVGLVALTRAWTEEELAADASLNGDPWYEGGVAILSHSHVTNGAELAGRACGAVAALRSRVPQLLAADEAKETP